MKPITVTLLSFCAAILLPLTTLAQTDLTDDLPVLNAQNPLTLDDLPSEIPYPVFGTLDDGIRDKFGYKIELRLPDEWESRDGTLGILTVSVIGEEDEAFDSMVYDGYRENDRSVTMSGLIDLSDDSETNEVLKYAGRFEFPDGRLVTFEHDVTLGNPLLTLRSTITSDNSIGRGIKVTSTVSGILRLGLSYASDESTSIDQFSGVGPVTYEDFVIEHSTPGCTINVTKKDGSFRVREIAFPDLVQSVDQSVGLPAPDEVLLFLDQGIRESATIRCPQWPVPIKFRTLIHYFSGFYSFHGGELGHENEANEDRGGMELRNWTRGDGNVIAYSHYERQGSRSGGTFTENTRLELKWPD